jgi:hypothetical protein
VRITTPVQGVSGTVLYEAIDDTGAPVAGPKVAVIGRIHGNEPVGDGVLARLAAEVQSRLVAGAVITIRGNEQSAEEDLRHTVEGSDLNRMWDPVTLSRIHALPAAERSYEQARAVALAPLLLSTDAILDLHSTSRPAAPFLIFRDDQRHGAIAMRLGVRHLVTGIHANGILAGGAASDIGLAAGERGPRLGFAFEAGQHTDPRNVERAWQVTERFLAEMGVWTAPASASDDDAAGDEAGIRPEIYEVTEKVLQAPADADPYRFVGHEGGEPGGGRRAPARKLHSFEEVDADEVILRRGRAEVIRAHSPFTMLMPAPATPPGTDLFYVAQPRFGGLTNGVPRTDEEARREATAIERMLDLLADDDFDRGATWVAFDARRLFDLCATIIGRALRLEPGDPHRKLTVLGRGDVASEDGERRAGQRYRQAMRAAIAEGLPVERNQLLRGANLAWFDALTSHGMLDLLGRRRERFGPESGVRMRISLRQPHTASLLVAGDLDLALRTGDTRYVRVALLIEAATVEPAGATARVRVARAGLVSTRPEVLQAAAGVLAALAAEHRHLVHEGPLWHEPAVVALLQGDDAIEAVPDPEHIEALRSALVRTQLRLWCDQLRLELVEPVHLADETSLGRWLARTMAATGILDAGGLLSLAVRRDGAGWIADPAHVQRLDERLATSSPASRALPPPPVRAATPVPVSDAVAPVLLFSASPPPSTPQPLFARDVDADDLERWVSWTRFVRGVKSIPDTRGKDLDLAFSGTDIRERAGRWFAEARVLAAERPGDVMVVVAGDGLHPVRDCLDDALPMYRSHREVLLDANVHYLRIQHAQGTHLSWMKDFLDALHQRPPSPQTVALQFEVEHGATVSAVLVLERSTPTESAPDDRPWTLDGWDVRSCGVVLSDLEAGGTEDYKIGLFTERLPGQPDRVNQELLHFGRAHCDGLLAQAGARVRAEHGSSATEQLERTLVLQIARWIERVRSWRRSPGDVPPDVDGRAQWVAHHLGLADLRLARALAREMDRDTLPETAAAAMWRAVKPWPGARFASPASPRDGLHR